MNAHRRSLLAPLLGLIAALTMVSSAAGSATVTFDQSYGFSGPAGLYAYGMEWDSSDNTILVGDYWNYRVQRFSLSGSHQATYLDMTGPKANGGIASAPYDIASDPTDMVGGGASYWAADQGSSNFAEFSHTGAWLQTIGKQQSTVTGTDATHPGKSYAVGCGNGMTTIPTHIMVDTVFSTHYLYVGDPRCRNVYIYDHQGVYKGELDWTGSGVGTPIPRGIAEDAAGNIYVAEYNSRRVFVFSPSTRKIIASSAAQSDLRDVRGIALDPTRHLIYAAGAALNRIYEYHFDPSTIATGTGAGSTVVQFVNEWRNTDGTNYALNHQAFDSIRFVAVDGSGNVYTGDTWGCPAYVASCTATNPVKDPGYGVLAFSPGDWTTKPSCNPANSTAQTTCVGATRLSWTAGSEPPPQGGFNQQNGIAVIPNDSDPLDLVNNAFEGLYVVDTFEQRVQKFDTSLTCGSSGNCPAWMLQWGSREPNAPKSQGFGYPRALTVGDDGLIWVGDNNNDVLAFNPDGSFVHRYGSQGKGAGQFSGGVQGIRVQGGRVYATDVAGCRLQIFDEAKLLQADSIANAPAGTLLENLGTCGTGTNQMSVPRGIAVDTANNAVYVVETGDSRISRWNLATNSATSFKPVCAGTKLSGPWGITWDPAHTWLYIGDVGNKRIVRWNPVSGACDVVATTATLPAGYTMDGSNFVEFGPDGRLYASDNSRHVYAFTITG
jgi:tripartite motif-containing protein 71